jgi:hypothetical protein
LCAQGRTNPDPRCVFQLIQPVPSRSCSCSSSDRCVDPAWRGCNGQTKTFAAHERWKLFLFATTNPKRETATSFAKDEVVNHDMALLWKSGARVAKWPIRTYNGVTSSLASLSSLPRWTPQPHPIQCDDFEPRRPHGGAFDSGPLMRCARNA